jgi:hypothetical protein
MATTEVTGKIWLVGVIGDSLTEPEPAELSWSTHDDGSFDVRFLTSHHLEVPPGTAGGVWLSFEGDDGRTFKVHQDGNPDVVRIHQ